MVDLTINFNQRMNLWMRLGTVKVPSLREAATYIRILEKIRPQENEMNDVQYKETETGIQYRLPSLNYGIKSIEFENEECTALIDGLMNHSDPWRVNEADWVMKLISSLESQIENKEAKLHA
jgi:hypothetical protein